jgi:hypothetical protein
MEESGDLRGLTHGQAQRCTATQPFNYKLKGPFPHIHLEISRRFFEEFYTDTSGWTRNVLEAEEMSREVLRDKESVDCSFIF